MATKMGTFIKVSSRSIKNKWNKLGIHPTIQHHVQNKDEGLNGSRMKQDMEKIKTRGIEEVSLYDGSGLTSRFGFSSLNLSFFVGLVVWSVMYFNSIHY